MIQLIGVKKQFGKAPHLVRAVDGIDLTIERGDFLAIIGRSGSGKTTLLDCIGLLMRPTEGQILFDGADSAMLSDSKRATLRSRHLGFVFQGSNLLPSLTALENVMLPLRYSGGDKKEGRRYAETLFEEIGLSDRMHHRPSQMSGGEQQRIAIARAVVNSPNVVLADEPTGEVDTETSHKLVALMRKLNQERGVAFLIVTHDLDLASRTDRIISLSDGRIVNDETPQVLVGRTGTLTGRDARRG